MYPAEEKKRSLNNLIVYDSIFWPSGSRSHSEWIHLNRDDGIYANCIKNRYRVPPRISLLKKSLRVTLSITFIRGQKGRGVGLYCATKLSTLAKSVLLETMKDVISILDDLDSRNNSEQHPNKTSKMKDTENDGENTKFQNKGVGAVDERIRNTMNKNECAAAEKDDDEHKAPEDKLNDGKSQGSNEDEVLITKNVKKRKIEEDASVGQPKPKKLRVKPERVKEVSEKLTKELAKNYELGMTKVSLDVLALGVGYKNHRSDAILEALKLLKKDGLVRTTKITCELTDRGVNDHVQEEKPTASPEEALQQFWKRFEMKLGSSSKSSGENVRKAAKIVFHALSDGKAHNPKDLVKNTTYSSIRSTGFEEIIKGLKNLEFIQKVNSNIEFTDKLFPFGRP